MMLSSILQNSEPIRRTPSPFDLNTPHVTRKQIEKAVGFRIRNIKYYQRALVHKSIQKNVRKSENSPEYMKRSNETIEFLGDSVLGMIIAEYLFRKYPDQDEGFLTRLRTRIVKGKTLGRLAKAIGLGDMILMSNHVIKIGGRNNLRILEDAFESIVGAIYMDLGLENARSFVLRVVKDNITHEQLFSDDNYKDLLLRYMQAKGEELPVYNTIKTEGPPHQRIFTIEVVVYSKSMGHGTANSKKAAEQIAAHQVIKKLNITEDF